MPQLRISFTRKILAAILFLFFAFTLLFMVYQYQREKEYKTALIGMHLQNYNLQIAQLLGGSLSDTEHKLNSFLPKLGDKSLRITLINPDGHVFYDNKRKDYNDFENHFNRPEVRSALLRGTGIDVRRMSETIGVNYFYVATLFASSQSHHYIIRSAMPYTPGLINNMKGDTIFVCVTTLILLSLILIIWLLTRHIGASINQLRKFAYAMDHNQGINLNTTFPNNELGEISEHIVRMYKRLHEAKDNLSVEREKLIIHLQISHEGLGIFTSGKKVILVNDLFLRYCDFISDIGLSASEDVLKIPEFSSINEFVNKYVNVSSSHSGEHRIAVVIEKNGRTFNVECVFFMDQSFEITINDATEVEAQATLKRQLTQNIAHELKTPVSSIQGYLETIATNRDLPPDTLYTFINRCYAQSNRLGRLLKDISVLSRMDDAPSMINKENIDLHALVDTVDGDVALQLVEKQILFRNLLPKGLSYCGNASLIYSIFRNFTDNAISYAGAGVTITIRCFRDDDKYYYLSFSDSGVGVPEESLNHLFDRFYRVDKGRSRKLGGTGLGLAIVKNAVILHGGNISVRNLPTGGLEFLFTLGK